MSDTRSPFMFRYLYLGLLLLAFILPTTAFAQQSAAEHEIRTPSVTRVALESAVGLGVWTATIGAGALIFWSLGAFDCDSDGPEDGCSGTSGMALGSGLLLGATAMAMTPFFINMIGNRHGTFGNMLISGLVGLAATLAILPLSPYLSSMAALALFPAANILGNVVTFELTHTPPPPTINGIAAPNGITANDFKLQPGIGVSFRF